MLEHGLGVGVGDEEADVKVGHLPVLALVDDGLPSEHKEVLGSLGEEAHEPLRKDVIKLIELLKAYTDTDRVDGTLDEDLLLLVSGDEDRVHEKLVAHLCLNLGLVVTLNNLGGKVLDAKGSSDGAADSVSVGLKCSGLLKKYILIIKMITIVNKKVKSG